MTESQLLPELSDAAKRHLLEMVDGDKERMYRSIAFYDMLRFVQMETVAESQDRISNSNATAAC